ncbi:hypothetical protein Phpb_02195 [Photorhabdus namnaonensis]|nr:hypothetical protein Phpb_02195 [Photorhabdus namnaonensis]
MGRIPLLAEITGDLVTSFGIYSISKGEKNE